MRRAAKTILAGLALILAIPALAIAVLFIALNTQQGRDLAVAQLNRLAGPQLTLSGLGGHFPADLKLRQLTLADAKGPYATATDLELRWRPRDLLSRTLHVTALDADAITILRPPIPTGGKSNAGNAPPPKFRLSIDHLAIGALTLPPSLAGQSVNLAVTGQAHLRDLTQGDLTLAAAANGRGAYQIEAAIAPAGLNAKLDIAEPPNGLLGHFAGPDLPGPLTLAVTLAGPLDQANLNISASLGPARLTAAGRLALDPASPKADITLAIPALAPFAALLGQPLAGSTTLHLIAARQNNKTSLDLSGALALTQGPGPAARLVGPNGHLALRLTLANRQADIETLNLAGAGFTLAAQGTLAPAGAALQTHIALNDVGLLSPGISGPLSEDGALTGTEDDFAVNALIKGDISERAIPSGPFSLTLNAQHLPRAPTGTLTGSGALENSPLQLDASFSRDAQGATDILINKALWRSVSAQADMSLHPDEPLPLGTAKFTIGNLADLAAFTQFKWRGGLDGQFAHPGAGAVALTLNAHQLLIAPSLGAINAQLSAAGPLDALAVKLSASIAKLLNAPASLALTALLDLDSRSASLSTLTANWRTLTARLQSPAAIETKPGLAVRHLTVALNGGAITLNGALTPRLNLAFAALNLPASLAALAAPSLAATGSLSLTAALTGTPASPIGQISLAAQNIRLHQGPAAALPAANLTAQAQLAGHTANLNAKLALGPQVDLAAVGLVPLTAAGPLSLHLTGTTDLRLLDPILAAQGSIVRGVITPDLTFTGTAAAPRADGTLTLAAGSVQNIASGLNLTAISASLAAAGRLVTLQNLRATAGAGQITGHGTIDLGTPTIPVDLVIDAANATPIASDLATESVNAALTLKGAARGAMALAGEIDLLRANINIPKSLPPSVANLPIINQGEPPPPPAPPPPPLALNLTIRAKNQIFIRGDGLFAELGGKVHLTGTAADPDPAGGFTLIRGNFALAGKTLQFTQGTVNFTGDGFIPSLDLEATTTTAANSTASLIIGGTAEKPTITLTATPPLPSDEVLSQLLFGQSTSSLSPFQAASLAAALASLSGVGGSAIADPLGGLRNALGLDELSLGGTGAGPPTVNAGRYVAPGIYVGAAQSTSGQGTQATVQINLYKGLQLQTAAGAGSGASSSVGLTYQFNY